MEKPLFNAETAPRPSKRAREPSIHARQSGTSGSCVAPGIPGKAASQKALPRIARFPLSRADRVDHSIVTRLLAAFSVKRKPCSIPIIRGRGENGFDD